MAGLIREWRNELDSLVEETGITLEDVCDYLGVSYPNKIGFYNKIPRKREMFIGIGMAFEKDLQKINEWIGRFGDKRKLYAKEVLSDLIWIYLINCNHRSRGAGPNQPSVNFYHLYDECQIRVQNTYIALWNEYVENDQETAMVESSLETVSYDEEFQDLRAFVAENMDSFKTAYRKPRNMLAGYVSTILDTYTRANDGKETPINFLRGYLDDSMMNYITGNPESINVLDMKSRDRMINIKAVPKLKRTHIALCLALGMSTKEINEYLDMMGYQPLDPLSEDENILMEMLLQWDEEDPLTQKYKAFYLSDVNGAHASGSSGGSGESTLSIREELQAVSDMLMMRSDLEYECKLAGQPFPYMKE